MSIVIGLTHIDVKWDSKVVRTSYQDGTYVEMWLSGIPTIQAEDWADILGYFLPWDHFRQHELMHTWLSVQMGHPYSPTLWTVAHDGIDVPGKISRKKQGMEEWVVTEFQKYLNTGEWSRAFDCMLAGYDLPALKRGALEFLKLHGQESESNRPA